MYQGCQVFLRAAFLPSCHLYDFCNKEYLATNQTTSLLPSYIMGLSPTFLLRETPLTVPLSHGVSRRTRRVVFAFSFSLAGDDLLTVFLRCLLTAPDVIKMKKKKKIVRYNSILHNISHPCRRKSTQAVL